MTTASRVAAAFARRPAFMPYFPLGYPTPEISIDVIEALARGGADMIEVGLPFSDPLADGPVIQRATQIALQQGMTVAKGLAAIAELRRRGVTIPLVLMGYYNPLLSFGLARLVAEAERVGADGFIVPDLPPEEAADLEAALELAPRELPLIRFLAPTTPPARVPLITNGAKGFIYMVSLMGVTGVRDTLAAGLAEFIARVRAETGDRVPLAVGFGIATPEQGLAVGQLADGIIVGSAVVKAVGEAANPVQAAEDLARAFKGALEPLHHPA
jgi:tryptophan synthase alpha chain